MKVLLINGSPHEKGCTYTALQEVEKSLAQAGIETKWVYLGKKPVSGCIACGSCKKSGVCIVDDKVNELLAEAGGIDGMVIGSPVYFASATGQISSFLDRLFYAAQGKFNYKPGAVVVSCRRGGSTATFDQLNKYFTIGNMPVVSSQYWNQVHGSTPEEVMQDQEGLQTMRTLGHNMAWLLKSIEAGKRAGIERPVKEPALRTNFIR